MKFWIFFCEFFFMFTQGTIVSVASDGMKFNAEPEFEEKKTGFENKEKSRFKIAPIYLLVNIEIIKNAFQKIQAFATVKLDFFFDTIVCVNDIFYAFKVKANIYLL